jgi:hypothetical protein
MIPSRPAEYIQRFLPPFNLARPPILIAAPVVGGVHAQELPRYFRECDDERLRIIMRGYPGRLSPRQWEAIAATFGCDVTVRQIQERWYNYARPGLDRSPFSVAERRQVAVLAMDHPHDWKWIASQLGNGETRSATMVKHCGLNILPKLQSLGFLIERASDIELVPDAAFEPGMPKGAVRASMLAQYRASKARIEGESVWDVQNLMARPFKKE